MRLHAQNLPELHKRTFEELQFLPNLPRGLLPEAPAFFLACLVPEKKILELLAQVTARERQAQLAHAEAAVDRAIRPLALHHFQSPLLRIEVASFRPRSRSASVSSFPGDWS
jgi:hypothetical protein